MDYSLPITCVSKHVAPDMVVLITRGLSGYSLIKEGTSVEDYNIKRGITNAQVRAMEIGSMFGWNVPGAYASAHQ